jgi:putative endonuclease
MRILDILTPKRRIGNFGEREAVRFLRKRGYKILEKNYTALDSEIDIIAKKDNVTAFIEVKTRNIKHLGEKEVRPASSVTPEKQRKIIKVANYYRSHIKPETRFRFDVVEVYLEDGSFGPRVTEIKHLIGAFDLNTAFDKKYHYIRQKEGSNL